MGTPTLSCSADALSNALIVDSDSDDDEVDRSSMWVQQEDHTASDLPPDFLEPLSPGTEVSSYLLPFPTNLTRSEQRTENRQFWKSGDFTGSCEGASFATEGMDHARVHPKFLHSNATSHKWVLGAIAELLDNAVDEIRNGATFVKIDVETNPRNGEPMLVIEDDGGGMDPDCMRHCMSLGYSAKSKLSNTIGQYGNGFKTSTMRLGADVIVFSRNQGSKPSESIGMMSYTFLSSTGQNDIVVPIVDFQIEAFGIRKLIRSNVDDWMESMGAIENWSPYSSQAELVSQFRSMPRCQGTKVIIYNLWEDEEGHLELDFTTDPHDIQIRATSRDEKTLKLAAHYPSCKHYLTHRHSLRIYISILYLRLPAKFKIILRGIQVPCHNLRNEMMLVEQVTYKPKDAGHSKAVVTLGFVKDAKEHIDVSGFNVYHKNRLIKPFWRVWNSSDTRGRGIIAILEANFVEPAHDKQGFERTIVLTRLEARLVEMQKSYFKKHCHLIGYTNASLRKSGQSLPRDTNSPAKGGVGGSPASVITSASTRAGEQLSAADERPVADVHDNRAASGGLQVQGVAPSVTKQAMQVASSNSLRVEVQEPNSMISTIDLMVDGAGNGNGVVFNRQGSVQVEPSHSHSQQCVQEAPLRNVTGSVLQNTAPSPANFIKQELFSPCPTGTAPVFIDLDSPEVDEKCENAAFDMPLPQSFYLQRKMIAEEIHACENSLQGDDGAGSPKGNEAEGVIDVSISFQNLGDVKALSERVSFEGCKGEDVRGIKQVEAMPKEQAMESYVQSVATAIDECLAAPIAITKNEDQVGLDPLGKEVQQNGACSEAHVLPTTIELDDFFDSLAAPQSEVPSHNSPPFKDTEALATEIKLILPEIGTVENDHAPLLSSTEPLSGHESKFNHARSEDASKEHENRMIDNSQVQCEDDTKDCNKPQLLPATEAKGLSDMDAVIDVDEHKGDGCLGLKQANTNDHKELVVAVVEPRTHENMALVPQECTSFFDKKDSLESIQVSCQDNISTPTMAIVDVAIDSIASNLCIDFLEEDRLILTKQQIEYLQQSIEAVVVEVDDLKEQLQQHRELEHLELTNLNMELERALSRLEEIGG